MNDTKRPFYSEVYIARSKKEQDRIMQLMINLNTPFRVTPNSLNVEYNRVDA